MNLAIFSKPTIYLRVNLILSLFLFSSNTITVAASITSENSTFQQAVRAYQQRNYAESLNLLKDLASKGQANELVHYYLALNYQGVSQISKAQSEYRWVMDNSSNNQLKYNAERGYNSLRRWSHHRLYEGNGNFFQRDSLISNRPDNKKLSASLADLQNENQSPGLIITRSGGG